MNPEFNLHATQYSLHLDKPQKNEIHSLNKHIKYIKPFSLESHETITYSNIIKSTLKIVNTSIKIKYKITKQESKVKWSNRISIIMSLKHDTGTTVTHGTKDGTCEPSDTGQSVIRTGTSHIASPLTTPASRGTLCPEQARVGKCVERS